MGKSVSVSLFGDTEYRNALAVVAKRHKRDIGVLVRDALDAAYGKEIAEVLSFFDQDVESIQQSLNDNCSAEANHA